MGTYALLQAEIEGPTLVQVRGALTMAASPRAGADMPVVAADAGGIVRDAFGVLVKRLERGQAERLRDAFAKLGYETVVAAEEELLSLPAAKSTRQIVPSDDALMYADVRDRMHAVAWDQVLVMIAGVVVKRKFKREVGQELNRYVEYGIHATGMVGGMYVGMPMMTVSVETKEIKQNVPQMQLLLGCEPWRLNVTGTGLNYGYLGARRTMNSAKNFAMVLNDILQRAKVAAASRGLRAMAGHDDVLPVYPTKGAFEEELCWLAWKAGRDVRGET